RRLVPGQLGSHARTSADHLAQQRAALQDHAMAQRLQAPMTGGGLPAWAYLMLVVGLCSLELPVVYLSFTALGLSPVFTALLAALCSALTGLLGHALGGLCRQLRVNRWFLLAVALAGSVAFVGALAYLRESAMEALTSESISLNPRAAAWAFFAISFATLGVAAELSWHQPPAVLAHELTAATRAWRRAERLAHRAQARSLKATRREMQTQRAIESLRAVARQRVDRLAMQVRMLMHVYSQANVRSRETNDLPPGLRPENLPAVTMPDELEQRSGTHVGTVERPA
ncbi:MAG TPA: hypothetical protein VK464_21520, partial [Symbiobacteriaceae bacterium]|nr:hypothetical protein [Symbiobacteriaceae bacterium]